METAGGHADPIPVIKKLISSYRRTLGQQHHPLEEYRYVHSAYKMVGVGSDYEAFAAAVKSGRLPARTGV
jgi:hypothetical protein